MSKQINYNRLKKTFDEGYSYEQETEHHQQPWNIKTQVWG